MKQGNTGCVHDAISRERGLAHIKSASSNGGDYSTITLIGYEPELG